MTAPAELLSVAIASVRLLYRVICDSRIEATNDSNGGYANLSIAPQRGHSAMAEVWVTSIVSCSRAAQIISGSSTPPSTASTLANARG